MGDHKELEVWRTAHALALSVYRLTGAFPGHELYGLTSQMRRAAASIPANLAEGCGRRGDAELCRFIRISLGSASELEYHLLLARDLGMVGDAIFGELNIQVCRVQGMLVTLMRALQPRREPRTAP
ncbi:MAG: four helix bundle protein [Gemmatimonadales bacterium]|nr:four helix bundle protein [Gemmatimonadales bacterium]